MTGIFVKNKLYNLNMSFQLVTPAYAAAFTSECLGTGEGADVATLNGITCLIGNLISPLPVIIALAAVIMIIIAGIRLTAAGSDPKAVSSAWQTFTWAIIGLVLLSVAWLVLVIIENVTGAKVTEFGFPSL